jgi:glycosyltransferase involved in cell wall biosynthesis
MRTLAIMPEPKRILILQCAREAAGSPEYNSQRTIVEKVDFDRIDPYFVWQTHTARPGADKRADLPRPEQNLFLDFGRDLEVPSKPPRVGRALMMARRMPPAMLTLRRHLRKIRPHAVYTSQQTVDAYVAKALCRRENIPRFLHLHYPVGPWLGPGMVKLIRETPRVVAASDFIRQQAIGAGVNKAPIGVQHSAVPLDRFSVPRGGSKIRAEFGWSASTPLIASVGRLDPTKKQEVLLKGFASKVLPKIPSARLLVCGAPYTLDRYDETLKKLAGTLGISDRVVFPGRRPDVPEILAEAEVFSLPTEVDACPLVFLEAMAAGLPAVAVLSGGVPEMVVHEETGLLSQPGDSDALGEHLLRLLENPDLARRMGEAGKKRVFAEFAPNVAAQRWTAMVERMLPT